MVENISYVFSVLLKKEIAYRTDKIAERVEKIVDKHFYAKPKEKLDTTQINRFTGIAYSSDNTKSLQEFIERQAGKESKVKKKLWTANDLHKDLLEQISKIAKTDSAEVYEEVRSKIKESLGEIVEKFDETSREKLIHDISIELLKRFATHFGIHYLYRGEEG